MDGPTDRRDGRTDNHAWTQLKTAETNRKWCEIIGKMNPLSEQILKRGRYLNPGLIFSWFLLVRI